MFFKTSASLYSRPSTREPILLPILLIEGADNDSLTGAGMDKFAVLQVDSHMGGPLLFPSVVEEDEVAFTELSFLHFLAILPSLVIGISFKILSIHLLVDGRG